MAPRYPLRIVVRYEVPGSEPTSQPEEEIDENTHLIVVRYVSARDGRPVKPQQFDPGRRKESQMIAGERR